jgi:hypothetical protein
LGGDGRRRACSSVPRAGSKLPSSTKLTRRSRSATRWWRLIEHGEARPLLEGALADAVDIASQGLIIEALVFLASVRMEADTAAATRLLAAVRTIDHARGRELDLRYEGRVLHTMEQSARERLGQRFEAEWEAGSRLTLEEAVALALDRE